MSARIACDHCDSDLTGGGPMPRYRLVIFPERIPTGDTEHALLVHPPMPLKVHHFCGWTCMDSWRAGQPNDSRAHLIPDPNELALMNQVNELTRRVQWLVDEWSGPGWKDGGITFPDGVVWERSHDED